MYDVMPNLVSRYRTRERSRESYNMVLGTACVSPQQRKEQTTCAAHGFVHFWTLFCRPVGPMLSSPRTESKSERERTPNTPPRPGSRLTQPLRLNPPRSVPRATRQRRNSIVICITQGVAPARENSRYGYEIRYAPIRYIER
jgi:hypothetical protein